MNGKTPAIHATSHTGPVVVGVDPGGRNTGLVVRWGRGLHWAALETRDDIAPLPGARYLGEVQEAIRKGLAVAASLTAGDVLLAVEEVAAPSPHLGLISVEGVLGTAMVYGAVLGLVPGALTVPPCAHGEGPKAAYPARLWNPRERVGKGRYRHCRSAWDIAGAALLLEGKARTA